MISALMPILTFFLYAIVVGVVVVTVRASLSTKKKKDAEQRQNDLKKLDHWLTRFEAGTEGPVPVLDEQIRLRLTEANLRRKKEPSYYNTEKVQLRAPYLLTLVRKEARSMFRSSRSVWLLGAMTVAVSIFFLAFWNRYAQDANITTRSQLARMIFAVLYITEFIGLSLISTIMASTSVTTERENRTLDLLYATGFSRDEVLFSKWVATIGYQLVVAVALLPIFALTFQLGGVDLGDYVSAGLLIVAGVSAYGMAGLAFSAMCRRTITALMSSVALTLALGTIGSDHRIFQFWSEQGWANIGVAGGVALSGNLFFLSIVFFASLAVAKTGLSLGETSPLVFAKPQIKDKRVLEQRKKMWPFYLIDPLAPHEPIADRDNPVYEKEKRLGGIAGIETVIRLGYASMFIAFVLSCISNFRGDWKSVCWFSKWMTLLISLFAPILASTCLSREREEQTLDLLRSTMTGPRSIVWAKYRVPLRFLAILTLFSIVFPCLMQSSNALAGRDNYFAGSFGDVLFRFQMATMMMLLFGAFYAAIGVFCSSLCKRNVTALVASYVTIFALIVSPWALTLVAELFRAAPDSPLGVLSAIQNGVILVRDHIGPMLSPFLFFDQAGDKERLEAFAMVVVSAGFLILLSALLIEAAVLALGRSFRE